MLTIRLSRTGKRKFPSYRIVVQDSHRDPWSPAIEIVGTYNPLGKDEKNKIILKPDRITHWLSQGAKPSATVFNLLLDAKLVSGEKVSSVSITKKRTAKLEQRAIENKAREDETKAKAKAAQEAKIKAEQEAKEAQKVEEVVQTPTDTETSSEQVSRPANQVDAK